MLRALVLCLLLANVAFWAYTGGYLERVGLAPDDPREPQRLAAQVAPEALVVLNAAAALPVAPVVPAAPAPAAPAAPVPQAVPVAEASPAVAAVPPVVATAQSAAAPEPPLERAAPPARTPAPAPGPLACWQATGLPRPQGILLRAALENIDGLQGRWSLTEGVLPARWIVYLGPFANAAALQQRRAELRLANIEHRELYTPNLSPGIALGTYSTPEAARRTLAAVTQQGVRGARVVQERPDTLLYTLRLDGITDAQRRRIEVMRILGDRTLQRCP